MPVISKASLRRKKHVRVYYDHSLLKILIFATCVIVLAVIRIPMVVEDEAITIDSSSPAQKVPLPPSMQQKSKPTPTVDEPAKVGEAIQIPKVRVESVPENEGGGGASHTTKDSYHTVFSTGCSTFQDWQSYVFFYHLLHSGQEGPVTRIASGCSDEDAQTLQGIFDREIAVMSPGRFRLHFTPDFSGVKPGTQFKYVRIVQTVGLILRLVFVWC